MTLPTMIDNQQPAFSDLVLIFLLQLSEIVVTKGEKYTVKDLGSD